MGCSGSGSRNGTSTPFGCCDVDVREPQAENILERGRRNIPIFVPLTHHVDQFARFRELVEAAGGEGMFEYGVR